MLHALGNHRAYGLAILVGFALPALADFGSTDSANLQYIRDHFENPLLMHVQSIATWSKLARDEAYDCKIELRKLTDSEFMDTIRSGESASVTSALFLTNYFNQALVPLKDNHSSVTGFAVRVTSDPVNQRLDAVTNLLANSGDGDFPPLDMSFFMGMPPATPMNDLFFKLFWRDYYDLWHSLKSGASADDIATKYRNVYSKYGTWRWDMFSSFYKLNLACLSGKDFQATNSFAKFVTKWDDSTSIYTGIRSTFTDSYYDQYAVRPLREALLSSGALDNDVITNLFTAQGFVSTNSATGQAYNATNGIFRNFVSSFMPSGLLNPDEVNTSLFEYVDSDISETPSFNPANLPGNGGLRSSSGFPAYDFDDSSGDYDYNLINPLKTATDKVQDDTDLDNKFDRLADLVNQRITSIFENPLNNISSQPARWQASLIDKDMNAIEDYVDPQYSNSSAGVEFVCWVCESMMFLSFFSFCVRRSLRVQQSREVASAI